MWNGRQNPIPRSTTRSIVAAIYCTVIQVLKRMNLQLINLQYKPFH